ncbi:MAG TPA: IS110 family transposase, partial [Acidimicrobiia bacterium]|nr:IS110 family transposase [Acidimicrobiia bacterium]
IPTRRAGYEKLLAWAEGFGRVQSFGIEGTSAYGADLTRFLEALGNDVLEVIRPNRQHRRRHGKSDPTDAEAAARAVLAGEATARPKGNDGPVEAIRVLRIARASAVKARTQAVNTLRGLVVRAPGELRDELRGLTTKALVRKAARLRPEGSGVAAMTKTAMRSLARRCLALGEEVAELDAMLEHQVKDACPELMDVFGVGTDSAGALLVALGDRPERVRSEAAFSMMCGASPLDASSGLQRRHRLNRGGDRQANAALYRIAIVRMRHEPRTRAYVARRLAEGKTKAEVIRCLKRSIAREVFGVAIGRRASQTPA